MTGSWVTITRILEDEIGDVSRAQLLARDILTVVAAAELADLTEILQAHQFLPRNSRCICGHVYPPGASLREHRAQMILDAGFHR